MGYMPLLTSFSFHRPVSSLFNNSLGNKANNGNSDELLFRLTFANGENLNMVFRDTNGRNIMINDRAYRMGLIGRTDKISDLFSQILSVTKH